MKPTTETKTLSRVVCAAVKMDNGQVISGVRHLSPDMRSTLRALFGPEYYKGIAEQGFIDSHGTYLTREEAWKRADALGQILYFDPAGEAEAIRRPAGVGDESILFSENLY